MPLHYKMVNEDLLLYKIGLENKIINMEELMIWVKHILTISSPDTQNYFLIELWWSKNVYESLNILTREIESRGLFNTKINGCLFYPFMLNFDLSNLDNLVFISKVLFGLRDKVIFSDFEIEQIYYIDECCDEYFEGYISESFWKEAIIKLLNSSN